VLRCVAVCCYALKCLSESAVSGAHSTCLAVEGVLCVVMSCCALQCLLCEAACGAQTRVSQIDAVAACCCVLQYV